MAKEKKILGEALALSIGKDSGTIALKAKEKGINYKGYFFADPGYEFPELYEGIKDFENKLNIKITVLKYNKSIEEWMKHKNVKGKSKGEYRGFPLRFGACSFMRDSKFYPLEKVSKNYRLSFGYASDEKHRVQKAKNLRYPLIEWNYSEATCAKILDQNSLLNPLYVNFNRLGCYFCPKQDSMALYVIWKLYPNFWKHMKDLNKLNIELGRGVIPYGDDLEGIEELSKKFENGWIPKKRPKYKCFRCEGVSKAFKNEVCLMDFKQE